MFNRLSPRLPVRHFLASCEIKSCRSFTTVSLHSRLPATVYRLQLLPKSNLSAYKQDEGLDMEEQVLVSSDGLVHPRVSDKVPTSNGPLFMPNTILMQDLARNAFDQYLEKDESRRPVLISIKKGTLLPASLIAFHHDPSQFSLQPLQPMKLSKLNSVLDELYASHATISDAEEWFDRNPFHIAPADTDMEQWQS